MPKNPCRADTVQAIDNLVLRHRADETVAKAVGKVHSLWRSRMVLVQHAVLVPDPRNADGFTQA